LLLLDIFMKNVLRASKQLLNTFTKSTGVNIRFSRRGFMSQKQTSKQTSKQFEVLLEICLEIPF
jgi:hypothetical protein